MQKPLKENALPEREEPQSVFGRQYHATRAMDQVDVVFEWVGEASDPVLRLLDAAHVDSEEAGKVQHAWSNMVRAHALDLLTSHDGQSHSHWERSIREGVEILVMLSKKHGAGQHQRRIHLQTLDFHLVIESTPGSDGVFAFDSDTISLEVLNAELSAYPASQALRDTEAMCDFLPGASMPVLAVATGTCLAVATIGKLSRCEPVSFSGLQKDWHAKVSWGNLA